MSRFKELTDEQLLEKAKIQFTAEWHGYARAGYSDRIYQEIESRGLSDDWNNITKQVIERANQIELYKLSFKKSEELAKSNFDPDSIPPQIIKKKLKDIGIVQLDDLQKTKVKQLKKLFTGEVFFLDVLGDSMTGRNINKGDTVVVNSKTEAKNGDIVVVRFSDTYYIKTFEEKDDKIYLRSENPDYEDIELSPGTDFEIAGVVKRVINSI